MIVITMKNYPEALRGDLTLWLQEIATGVYVGHVSARIRNYLWQRVKDHIGSGEATLSYTTNNEQHYTFETLNSKRQVIHYEGIDLLRVIPTETAVDLKAGFSRVAKQHKVKKIQAAKQKHKQSIANYTVLDIETTGLDPLTDHMTVIGALRIRDGEVTDQFHKYIQVSDDISPEITALTGITSQLLQEQGQPAAMVLQQLHAFIAPDERLVMHNGRFDLAFLNAACARSALTSFDNDSWDTLILAKRQLKFLESYRLEAVAEHFKLDFAGAHEAMKDCEMTHHVFQALLELKNQSL